METVGVLKDNNTKRPNINGVYIFNTFRAIRPVISGNLRSEVGISVIKRY